MPLRFRGIFSCDVYLVFLSCAYYFRLLPQKDVFELFFTHGFLNREVGQVVNDDQPIDEGNHDQSF
jgi:hypothetical protein